MSGDALPQYVSRQTIARMFDTSVSTVRRWEAERKLPPALRINNLDRWDLSALLSHFGRAIDGGGNDRPRSADEAADRVSRAAREGREAHARRRQRENVQLPARREEGRA